MGVLFFLIFVIGLCSIAKELTKGIIENHRELDSYRSEDEKHNSKLMWWTKGYEYQKRKKRKKHTK